MALQKNLRYKTDFVSIYKTGNNTKNICVYLCSFYVIIMYDRTDNLRI